MNPSASLKPTILIVEDEPHMVDLISYNLHKQDYQVLSADNGRDGLHCAQRALPDLILLDLMLPDIDGFTVCKLLRNQPATRHIPIVMLTAMTGELSRLHGLECGATDYLTKPVKMRELTDRIGLILQQPGAPAILCPARGKADKA